jgi:gamma-butyrobetaine dioxygenase
MKQRLALPEEGARSALVDGICGALFEADAVMLDLADGQRRSVSAARLYNDAAERFDPTSGQRLFPAVSEEHQIACVRATENGLCVVFDDQAERTWTFSALARCAPPPTVAKTNPADGPLRLTHIAADAFLRDEHACRKLLAAVARQGACLLKGYAGGLGGLEAIVARFGHIRQTNYGRLFDVRVEEGAANLAFTDLGLAPHTDNPYREPPPGIQLLHCLTAATTGGQTLLVDGFAAALRLRAANPAAFEALATTPVRFAWADADVALEAWVPVIERDARGDLVGLRVNDRAQTGDDNPAWRDAYRAFTALLNDPSAHCQFTLEPGDVLIFDNRRMLHGRTAYAGGARWLQGCYADRDGLLGRLRAMELREAQARAESALAELAGPAGDETYGEGLSLRAHCLQAAALASSAGLSPALIAAALLHDIGWALGGLHEEVGAAFVEDRFGPELARPIRLHVKAKRYLVATDPDYRAQLSLASVQTLALQGGPMPIEEARRFEDEPGFADAVALRRIDDKAKNPLMPTVELEAYRTLLIERALVALRTEAL